MELVAVVCGFDHLYFEIWARHKGGLVVEGAPNMHSVSGLSRAGHMHLER
jgi:hypothetical protein